MSPMKLNLLEHGRATEWLTSLVLLMFAVTLALPGDTLASPTFRAFRAIGADEAMIATPIALLAAGGVAGACGGWGSGLGPVLAPL